MKEQKKAPGTAKGQQVLTTSNLRDKGTQNLPTMQEGNEKNFKGAKHIRVGSIYHRVRLIKNNFGGEPEVVLDTDTNERTIVKDHGQAYLANIPKYDCFGILPEHINYQRVYVEETSGWKVVNEYQPLAWKSEKGEWPNIEKYLRHIFGEQYEYGLEYIQMLYFKPLHPLPILLLVGNQGSAKSTFITLLRAIFGMRNTYASRKESFCGEGSRFNMAWKGKLIIGVDEAEFPKKDYEQTIKYLSTTKYMEFEGKGREKEEAMFFGKIIMTTNNVINPIYIDSNDTRHWVREVPPLPDGAFVDEFFEKVLCPEIPAFLYFIANEREFMFPKSIDRLHFKIEDLKTDMYRQIQACGNSEEYSVKIRLLEIMEFMTADKLCFSMDDLTEWMSRGFRTIDEKKLLEILHKWALKAGNPSAYDTFDGIDNNGRVLIKHVPKRKYYTITKGALEKI